MIIDSLEIFSNYSIKIREELKFCKEFYASIKEGKLTDEINHSTSKKSSDMFVKEYKSVLNSHNLKAEIDSNSLSISNKKISIIENSLNKYEEFKNSLKSIYNLHNRNLLIDNKIRNFIEKENHKEKNVNLETFENFYLETSIEMFREIFGYQK